MITTLEYPEGKEFDLIGAPINAAVGEIVESIDSGLWVVVKRRWTIWGHLRLIVEPAGSFAWPVDLCPSCGNSASFRAPDFRACEPCEIEWSMNQ